jgi:hypothetical protein
MVAQNTELVQEICDELVQAWTRSPYHLRAIVLTGSMARGEGSVLTGNGAAEVLGDAEFVVVFGGRAALPAGAEVDHLRNAAESALRNRGIRCHLSTAVVRPGWFRALPPAIFTYELRTCGKVVWGDRSILNLIPEIDPARISREDAWRLLSNRLIELIEAVLYNREIDYRLLKLSLDMATSASVFLGVYAPTYRDRALRLQSLAASVCPPKLPIPLEALARTAARATEAKLSSRPLPSPSLQSSLAAACSLWDWEVRTLARLHEDIPAAAAARAWLRRQPPRDALRGWASAVKRSSIRILLPRPGHWTGHLAASPRYWTYLAARELLPHLAALASGSPDPALYSGLPSPPPTGSQAGWRDLAAAVVNSYHTYLEGTRA